MTFVWAALIFSIISLIYNAFKIDDATLRNEKGTPFFICGFNMAIALMCILFLIFGK